MALNFQRLIASLEEENKQNLTKPALMRQAWQETANFEKRIGEFLHKIHSNNLFINSGLNFELTAEEFGFALKAKNKLGTKSAKTAFINPCYFGEVAPWMRGKSQEASLPVFIYANYPEPEVIKSSYQVYNALHGGFDKLLKEKPEFYRGVCKAFYGYVPLFNSGVLVWQDPKNASEGTLSFDQIFEKIIAELVDSLPYR